MSLPCLYPVYIIVIVFFVLMNHWDVFFIRKHWIVHFILSDHLYFSWARWFMKMEKKQCAKCKRFLLFECFKNSKKSQLTKCCVKCLENFKKSRQQTKCEHGRQRSRCEDCGGGGICEHERQRPQCKDCDRSQICEHNKIRSECKDCGGSHICEHNKKRSRCQDCGGSQICEHNKERSACPTCDPLGHLAKVIQGRAYIALKIDKEMSSTEYLGRLKNILNNNSQKACHGKITVNGTSIITYR